MPVAIATWNINSIRLRLPMVLDFIAQHRPDVIMFQEIKCTDDQFPRNAFVEAGYLHMAVHGQKGYHGVAIVSKFPLTDVSSRVFCEIPESRHVSALTNFGHGPVTLHDFYIPAGGDEPDPEINPKFKHKMGFLSELTDWFAEASFERGHIIAGDFNIAPHENDVWNHKQLLKVVSHTPIEIDALNGIQNGGYGWTDLIRKHIPYDQKLYSWWSYRGKEWDTSDRGRRLDHIWSTADVAEHCIGAEILRPWRGMTEKPSDHVPVIAHFRGV
jgi:exodeoxyribonuclease-3